MKKESGLVSAGKDLENATKSIQIMEEIQDTTKGIFQSIERIIYPRKTSKLTLGHKSADILAKGAGSWIFIIGFLIFIALWMLINIYGWTQNWDPYPFILLNLVLSCLAAIQAPIILMSQNRSSQRDRLMATYDYKVNRKAEKEIQEIKIQLDRIEKKMKK
jgi:uncharacterized membrane protein